MTAITEANATYADIIYKFIVEGDTKGITKDFARHLLEIYANDLNSSTLREFVTLQICGYKEDTSKLGRDGWCSKGKPKEVKPKNIIVEKLPFDKKGNRKGSFTFGGNFSDYTYRRYHEDVKDGLDMVCSLFVDGRALAVVEFPVTAIAERLEAQLDRGVATGQKYVRACSFGLQNVSSLDEVELKYVNDTLFGEWKDLLTRGARAFIEDRQ